MFARACVCDFSCSDQQFVRIRAALTLTYKQRVCENNFVFIQFFSHSVSVLNACCCYFATFVLL